MDEQPDGGDWLRPLDLLLSESPPVTIPDVSVAETLDNDIWYDAGERSEENLVT